MIHELLFTLKESSFFLSVFVDNPSFSDDKQTMSLVLSIRSHWFTYNSGSSISAEILKTESEESIKILIDIYIQSSPNQSLLTRHNNLT